MGKALGAAATGNSRGREFCAPLRVLMAIFIGLLWTTNAFARQSDPHLELICQKLDSPNYTKFSSISIILDELSVNELEEYENRAKHIVKSPKDAKNPYHAYMLENYYQNKAGYRMTICSDFRLVHPYESGYNTKSPREKILQGANDMKKGDILRELEIINNSKKSCVSWAKSSGKSKHPIYTGRGKNFWGIKKDERSGVNFWFIISHNSYKNFKVNLDTGQGYLTTNPGPAPMHEDGLYKCDILTGARF